MEITFLYFVIQDAPQNYFTHFYSIQKQKLICPVAKPYLTVSLITVLHTGGVLRAIRARRRHVHAEREAGGSGPTHAQHTVRRGTRARLALRAQGGRGPRPLEGNYEL